MNIPRYGTNEYLGNPYIQYDGTIKQQSFFVDKNMTHFAKWPYKDIERRISYPNDQTLDNIESS